MTLCQKYLQKELGHLVDMTLGDGQVDSDIGGDEYFVTLTETSNMV